MQVSDILSRVRFDLGDEKSDSDFTWSSLSSMLSRIRTELNDTADTTSAATTSIISTVRSKIGDPADSVLGTTTAASVTADSVIHYAQWSTTGSVTGTDSSVNSSVEIASSSGSLSDYAADGIKTIKGMRPDAIISGNLHGGFQNALNLYVLARCLEGEVETEVGSAGYRAFYDRFAAEVGAVPAHISDSAMTAFLDLGTTEITARRPDLGNSICKSTLEPLEIFVIAQAAQSKLGTAAHPNLTSFYSALDSIPHHYTDTELNEFIDEAKKLISSVRDDLVTSSGVRSDVLPAAIFCIASLATNHGADPASRNLSDTQFQKLNALLNAVPYHWPDSVLLDLLNDSVRDIIRLRCDARMNSTGGEISVSSSSLSQASAFPLRDTFAKPAEAFCVYGAISSRIGKESGADLKYKLWLDRYNYLTTGR